jgi:acyl carrier protein
MDRQKFLDQFVTQFMDIGSSPINFETEFRKIDSYDSLTGMAILVMIKDEYNVDLPVEEFRKQHTIEELFQLVKSKLL